MRMEIGAEAISRLVGWGATACGGAAVVGTLSEWTMALLGVPLIVVLAAVSGIALVVSYQPHQAPTRLTITVVSSIFVACSAAVFSIEYGGWPKGAAAFTAAGVGAALQIFVPWFIVKGPALLDRIAAGIKWPFSGSGGGSQS